MAALKGIQKYMFATRQAIINANGFDPIQAQEDRVRRFTHGPDAVPATANTLAAPVQKPPRNIPLEMRGCTPGSAKFVRAFENSKAFAHLNK
jgi:hypothetical protein